jgi:hypothetical protein
VPQESSAGKVQLVATFNTGPLAAIIQARREIVVQE